MSVEWGIFSDEGLVEGDCWSPEQAAARLSEGYAPDDGLTVGKICPSCRLGWADWCDCEEPALDRSDRRER